MILTDSQRRTLALGEREKGVEIFWDTWEEIRPLVDKGYMQHGLVRAGRRTREFAFTTDKGRMLVGISSTKR